MNKKDKLNKKKMKRWHKSVRRFNKRMKDSNGIVYQRLGAIIADTFAEAMIRESVIPIIAGVDNQIVVEFKKEINNKIVQAVGIPREFLGLKDEE